MIEFIGGVVVFCGVFFFVVIVFVYGVDGFCFGGLVLVDVVMGGVDFVDN